MYAVRTESNPGRSLARLHPEHPALAEHRADAVVYDEFHTTPSEGEFHTTPSEGEFQTTPSEGECTDWSDDVDLTIDPLTDAAPRRRRSSPLLAALLAVAFLMMVGLGALGALVLGAAAVAVVALALGPAPAPLPAPAAIVDPPAVVAPVEPAPAEPPVAPAPAEPSGTAAPADDRRVPSRLAEEGVEAELVVMPDPGFRTVPVDRAVKKLHERAGKGEIGSVAGH